MEDEEGAAKDEKKEIREYLRFYNFTFVECSQCNEDRLFV